MNGYLRFTNIDFNGGQNQILVATNGVVEVIGNYSISASCLSHFRILGGGKLLSTSRTVTINGSPVWDQAFARVDTLGYLQVFQNVYSGASTGPRYTVASNAVINVYGGGATFFPGNTDGGDSSGGVYL